ncbi:extracellular solute-binding protein [Butyrivibrio sp. VCB2006]|uniref:extracellular solute-binding protein n=1 Tax=Butyrivibrio sp. VCB2006 TaxID=1280679 RepID=UPI00041AA516|nr:extracellular solute-binding protein [Butyrivibrio sp. VCB2006]
MKKRVISSLLIVVMVLTMVACEIRPGKGPSITEENAYKEWDIDFSEEPTTITYLTIGDKPTNGMTEYAVEEINKILLKKVNAKLDICYVSWDDYLSKYNSILSLENSDIDLVGTSTDWLDAWANAQKGNFLPMSKEMIQAFCPMTYMNVTDEEWRKCSYDGDVYFIPENEYTQWTNHGFIYRSDLAKEAGLEQITSWKDLTKYLKYIANHRVEMIPWDADGTNTIIALGYIMSAGKYNPIYEISTYGIWGAYSDGNGKIVSPYYEGDDFLEFAKLMKEWKRIGVWRGDLSSAGDNTEEFIQGYSALVQHHTQNYYTSIKPEMDARNPSAETGFFWFGQESSNLMKTSILHGAMAVSSQSKNPEKALMVYDVLRNDRDCYCLLRYGREGYQYIYNKERMIEKPSGYNADINSIVTNFWWGRRDDYELLDADVSWDEYYDLLNTYEHVSIDYPWDGYDFSYGVNEIKLRAVISVFDKYMPEICYGSYDITPEAEVNQFRGELKEAGIEDITRQLQKMKDSY